MKMANDQFDITVQEQQFLKVLREWNRKDTQDIQVIIERAQGASWGVEMRQLGAESLVRGTGATFAEAWNNMHQLIEKGSRPKAPPK
jgi:hypothetical protein